MDKKPSRVLVEELTRRIESGDEPRVDEERLHQFADMLSDLIVEGDTKDAVCREFAQLVDARKRYGEQDRLAGFSLGVLWGACLVYEKTLKKTKGTEDAAVRALIHKNRALLDSLSESPGMTVDEIAKHLGVPREDVIRDLGRLMPSRLVAWDPSPRGWRFRLSVWAKDFLKWCGSAIK